MENVALNKFTTASSYIQPFSPSRAVDGNMVALSRWLSNVPASMTVDLGAPYWIGRWVCHHMCSVGWAMGYNNTNYTFYGSLDGSQWIPLDSVVNNKDSMTDRTIKVTQCRFVRLTVTKGLAINPQIAGVVELEVYDAPPPVSSSKLQSLTISSGDLVPSFDTDVLAYNVTVSDTVSSITLTPTSIEEGTIKVNGQPVASGAASQAIDLQLGNNSIQIEVTSKIGAVKTVYTVNVSRVLNLYLEKVDIKYNGKGYSSTSTILMNHDSLNYSDSTSMKAVGFKVVPYAEDTTVNIAVAGQVVPSGTESSNINFTGTSMNIEIVVSKSGYSKTLKYELDIQKG